MNIYLQIIWVVLLTVLLGLPLLKIVFYYSNSKSKLYKLGRKLYAKKMSIDIVAKLFVDEDFESLSYIRNNCGIEDGNLRKMIEDIYIHIGYNSAISVITNLVNKLPPYTKEVYNNEKFLTSDELEFIKKYTNLN